MNVVEFGLIIVDAVENMHHMSVPDLDKKKAISISQVTAMVDT